VLANTNLNVLTAVFYWFTLKRDEPFLCPQGEPAALFLYSGCLTCFARSSYYRHAYIPDYRP
ncbi:hypothetical protein, partial [Serratia nevei]|uniref:hypothetical protein n=1 Tax=Serratia nevei TaxID=2703794 RepID=UPI0035589223